MGRLRRIFQILRLRGPSYPWHLLTEALLPRLASWVMFENRWSGLCQRMVLRLTRLGRSSRPKSWPAGSAAAKAQSAGPFLSGREWLPESTLAAAMSAGSEGPSGCVALGRIDNDGRVLPLRGPLPGLDAVAAETFVARYRYDLELVLVRDNVLIRKDFRGDRPAFLREWRSLAALGTEDGSPAIYDVDERAQVLYKSFVPGSTIRQLLVAGGAAILSVDTETDPELAGLDPEARIEAVWASGQAHFADALPPGFLTALENRLDRIHRRGVTGFSLSFGNVVIHQATGEPWFIDFDGAIAHRRAAGLMFHLHRDRDRELFNRIYNRELLTERAAGALLSRVASPYSPVDLGRGLASRGFWSIDSGTGRWEILNRRALRGLIEGRRILDLGSFNGLMPLSMLAAGARQVVAIERSEELVALAHQLRRLFEWRDMRRYDLDLRRADMRDILDGHWGEFDLVTSFCSLYYLAEEDMRRLVRRASELAPILVLQAKIDTRPTAADNKAEKSSLCFLRSLLEENGFPRIEVVAPAGYSRPLLIGRQARAEALDGG